MKKISLVTVLFISVVLNVSCKKFDQGGIISKADKNIVEQWSLSSYFRNESDESAALQISGYTEKYMEDGTCSRTYNMTDGKLREESGTWKSNDGMKTVNVSGFSSLELSKTLGTVSSSAYTIVRLTKSEFWYRYQNGSDTHEFHFEKK